MFSAVFIFDFLFTNIIPYHSFAAESLAQATELILITLRLTYSDIMRFISDIWCSPCLRRSNSPEEQGDSIPEADPNATFNSSPSGEPWRVVNNSQLLPKVSMPNNSLFRPHNHSQNTRCMQQASRRQM